MVFFKNANKKTMKWGLLAMAILSFLVAPSGGLLFDSIMYMGMFTLLFGSGYFFGLDESTSNVGE
jgi:hypothetical protein